MFRTLSQIESILLKKANHQLLKEIEKPIASLVQIFQEYDISDRLSLRNEIMLCITNNLKTSLTQESMLLYKSNELIMKIEDLEDMVYDVCSEAI